MEAKIYFEQEIFQQLARELKRRYYLKGQFGSTIGLKNFVDTDTEPLRKLLGITAVRWQKKKSITIEELEQAIQKSALAISLFEFVELRIGEELLTKEMVDQAYDKTYSLFLSELGTIDEQFSQLLTTKQLQDWLSKTQGNMEVFRTVSRALNNLPLDYTRLPVFSYKMNGNPHSLDADRPEGTLLLQVLTAKSKTTEVFSSLSKTEQKNEIYMQFHLLKDDIMNFVAINGLLAYYGEEPDKMWQAACQNHHSWNVPLKEILPLKKIRPISGDTVLVVENSGIYSILLDRYPDLPIICSNGQFRHAVWVLLRKLVNSNVTLQYVGDMDPEGLLMAETLRNIFPRNIQYFTMTPSIFEAAKSKAVLSEKRVKQLDRLKDPILVSIAAQIKSGTVAYQEAFIEQLIDEIAVEFPWL